MVVGVEWVGEVWQMKSMRHSEVVLCVLSLDSCLSDLLGGGQLSTRSFGVLSYCDQSEHR